MTVVDAMGAYGDRPGTDYADSRLEDSISESTLDDSHHGGGCSGDAPPTVSVVVPVFECANHIESCLAAVAAQTYRGHIDVTVALAPSSDGTRQALARAASELSPDLPIRVIDNPAISTPAGLNAAIADSSGDIVVRVDAQSRLPPDYVERAVTTMKRTGAGNVGGLQRPTAPADSGPTAAIAAALSSPFGGGPAAYRRGRREGPTDTVYLGVFDRRALDAVGGFDESLERNQDYELNWRLRQAGYTVWLDPALTVGYTPRSTYRDLASQYFHYGAWKRRMLWKNPRSLKPRQIAPPALLAVLFVSAVQLARGRPTGAAGPLLYVAACSCAAARFRSTLPDARDRLRVAFACAVIHLSWGFGFLIGRPRRRAHFHTVPITYRS